MARPTMRRSPRLESLESRNLMTAGGPGPDEQAMLYMINQFRQNPAAAAQWASSNLDGNLQATLSYYNIDINQVAQAIAQTPARPPVAWDPNLSGAANWLSQDEANSGVQSHTGSDGSTPDQRMDRFGVTNRAVSSENSYAYATGVDQAMRAFVIDWGVPDRGHFRNLFQPNPSDPSYRAVGIGIVPASKDGLGPEVVTQDFALQNGSKAEIVGVAFRDQNGNNFYDSGEGQGNVEIDVTNLANGQTQTTQTWDAGGYQVAVDPGAYAVTAKVNGQVVKSQQVNVGNDNVEVDFRLDQPWQPTAPPVAIPVAPVNAATAIAQVIPVTPPTAQAQAQAQPSDPAPVVPPTTAPVVNQDATPTINFAGITSWQSWNAI